MKKTNSFNKAATAILFLLCFGERFILSFSTSTPCALRATTYGNVCVCNTTYCDFLDPVSPVGDDGIVFTSSSKVGLRFDRILGKFSDKKILIKDLEELSGLMKGLESVEETVTSMLSMESEESNRNTKIQIDRNKKHQKFVGFGGALTGAVSYNLKNLPQELQDSVYKSYFSKEGIGYTIIRMPIGGSDFDLEPWAYNEEPEDDTNLSNFTKLNDLDEDKIKQMERLKSVANIEHIKIMGSAWSPPKWMKTSHSWDGFSFLEEKYYQTWALYHLKFIELMQENNMPVWAITTGNEPLNAVLYSSLVKFVSLGWTPNTQSHWVADNLGPTIKQSKFKDVKIFCNDGQTFTYPFWFVVMNMTRKESIDYLDGLAVHWYFDEYYGPRLIDETHRMMPDKLIFNTESTVGSKPKLGSWADGEKYTINHMRDLKNSFNGYIDWNMILNEEGGPTYIDNFSSSPIIANETSGQEIYKQPMFYAIGHFSKFLPEGSVRIEAAKHSNKDVDTVAFQRPDGTITCVISNYAQEAAVVNLADSIRGDIEITIPPKSLHTIEYN
ncbi:lysosomal acid glucosylceramidase-like [Eupeodes corollae]|uniref:lysosomal acid glucosylceramidase-like n=1 Tax=Eupeodes corollae TaxID=290404 RepID=UPI002492C627|nr:lysosomal acid glucosylceramidase-like [Eupeodes corollae]